MNEMINNLINYLTSLESVVIAFSGGVDSTFLAKAAFDALKNKSIAITIKTPYIPEWEIQEAIELARKIGINHKIVELPVPEIISKNPKDRCYLCKKIIFTQILSFASEQGFNFVVDGTNFDDLGDYRPGLKALSELKVKSPLLECKFTKQNIRDFSREMNLSTWDKPAYACLLTRIPYDSEFETKDFRMIEQAEIFLMNLGFREVRVRKHQSLARIELNSLTLKQIFQDDLHIILSQKLKEIGFEFVTIDLQGYQMGSFNQPGWKNEN